MKLPAIAASAVLAAGVLGAAASAKAAIVFDISYTSATICTHFGPGGCSADPGFEPFTRRLTFQLPSVHHQLETDTFGPGSFLQRWTVQASFGPDGESPELLAVGGLAPAVASGGPFHWAVLHDPVDGIDLTDFLVGGGLSAQVPIPGGFIDDQYFQSVQLPGDSGEVPGAPSSPVDNNGFLDYLASLGPFEADEYGSTQPFIDGLPRDFTQVRYRGTATLDRAASSIPVPEPAAWTLMIAGFGLAGAALRRPRSLAVAA